MGGRSDAARDLGLSITLRGDPEDRALMQAALGGDYVVMRRMLLAPPYRVDAVVPNRIITDLMAGRAAP
jgi:hypothetical protein